MSSQSKSMQLVVNLFIIHVIISLISSVQLHCKGAPANARVESFPGYHGNISFEIYAGYVTVSEVTGRELFYYFVKSERNPENDPLLLWLTGGPGCTGLTGFAYEIGPMNFDIRNNSGNLPTLIPNPYSSPIAGPMNFDIRNNSGNLPTLIPNPYSWTKVSNIIFLDSPVGTGFSYSNTSTDYMTGDFKAVSDINTFLIKWFEAFPEFLSNPFYVGGDSYSGIIVPLVVNEIANENAAGINPTLNLKGYLVGNGKTDVAFDNAQVPFAHGKGLISDELYQAIKETCNSSYLYSTNASCQSNLVDMWKVLNGTNRGNILDPVCDPETLNSQRILTKRYEKLEIFDQFLGSTGRISSHGCFTKSSEDGCLTVHLQHGYQDRPCPVVNKYLLSDTWANIPYVRKAIHAQSEEITGVWERCTHRFKYDYQVQSVIEYHRNLTRKGYRALIYSGDLDLIFPFIGTEAWVRSLNYTILDAWRSWWVDQQVAGYTRLYENNLTFATIKGGGHTAPEYKPRQGSVMFKKWILGERL